MMAADLFDRMHRHPAADWTIAVVEKICCEYGCSAARATGVHMATPSIRYP
jgi:hypothetical protein